jgi:hypothetical protein
MALSVYTAPSIQPAGFSIDHTDKKKELSGKMKGAVCFMINYSWCDSSHFATPIWNTSLSNGSCVTSQENCLLSSSRPCIFPLKQTLWQRATLDFVQTGIRISWGRIIVAGDLNKANLRKTLLRFYQQITYTIRSSEMWDHCCSTLPIGRNLNRKYPWSRLFNVGLTNWNLCFKIVLITFRVASKNNIDVYTDSVTHWVYQEVHRGCCSHLEPIQTQEKHG